MLFNEFGNQENPPILLLHGMMQDWHSEYELMKPLEEKWVVCSEDASFTKEEIMELIWFQEQYFHS